MDGGLITRGKWHEMRTAAPFQVHFPSPSGRYWSARRKTSEATALGLITVLARNLHPYLKLPHDPKLRGISCSLSENFWTCECTSALKEYKRSVQVFTNHDHCLCIGTTVIDFWLSSHDIEIHFMERNLLITYKHTLDLGCARWVLVSKSSDFLFPIQAGLESIIREWRNLFNENPKSSKLMRIAVNPPFFYCRKRVIAPSSSPVVQNRCMRPMLPVTIPICSALICPFLGSAMACKWSTRSLEAPCWKRTFERMDRPTSRSTPKVLSSSKNVHPTNPILVDGA